MKFRLALGFTAAVLMGLPGSSSGQSSPGSVVHDSVAKSSEALSPPDTWSAKPIGSYDLVLDTRERKMPTALTISETNGKLSALVWPEGDNDGRVMDVTVNGVDLVLTTVVPRGPVTITIEKRGKTLSGKWSMGMEGGLLTGTTKP